MWFQRSQDSLQTHTNPQLNLDQSQMTIKMKDKFQWKTQEERTSVTVTSGIWVGLGVYWCLRADHWGSESAGLEGLSRYAYDECINQLFIFAVDHIGQRPATVAGSLEPRRKHRGRWLFPVPFAAKCLLRAQRGPKLNGQNMQMFLSYGQTIKTWRHEVGRPLSCIESKLWNRF